MGGDISQGLESEVEKINVHSSQTGKKAIRTSKNSIIYILNV